MTRRDADKFFTDKDCVTPLPGGNPAAPGESAPAGGPVSLDRRSILDATEQCLDEHGYDGATIRAIARTLGCAVGTIYRYFPDKRALLLDVTQRRFEPVLDAVEQQSPLIDTARLYLARAQAAPQQYRLMFWLAATAGEPGDAIPPIVRRILAGWARQSDDPTLAHAFWAQLHGSLMLELETERTLQQAALLLAGEHTPA